MDSTGIPSAIVQKLKTGLRPAKTACTNIEKLKTPSLDLLTQNCVRSSNLHLLGAILPPLRARPSGIGMGASPPPLPRQPLSIFSRVLHASFCTFSSKLAFRPDRCCGKSFTFTSSSASLRFTGNCQGEAFVRHARRARSSVQRQ